MRSFFVTAMLAGVLAAGAACGGDSEPTPTVVPQAALVPTSTPVPTRAAGPSPTPTLSDLLDRVPGRFVSLEEIESGSAFGDQIGPALEEFGWITQYRNSFTRGTTFLASSLSLFSTSVGAAGWFTWLPEGVQNIEEASAEEFKYSTSRSFGLDPESIAVDYAPLRLKSTAQPMFGVRITAEFTGMTNRVWWVCILEKESRCLCGNSRPKRGSRHCTGGPTPDRAERGDGLHRSEGEGEWTSVGRGTAGWRHSRPDRDSNTWRLLVLGVPRGLGTRLCTWAGVPTTVPRPSALLLMASRTSCSGFIVSQPAASG